MSLMDTLKGLLGMGGTAEGGDAGAPMDTPAPAAPEGDAPMGETPAAPTGDMPAPESQPGQM